MARLRAIRREDLPALTGDDSEFADFGPRTPRTEVPGADLEEAGALAIDDDDGELAGLVSWHWAKHWGPTSGSRCPMIGIWLRPPARGRGLGRIAQGMLAELLFTHTTAHRIEAHTDIDNLAEQRALERAGFTREGVTRGAQWRGGRYRDGVLYAILRDDPRSTA